MNNPLIQLTNDLVKDSGIDVWVTLNTGGLLINGIICSWKEYSKHNPITEKINDLLTSNHGNTPATDSRNTPAENFGEVVIYLKSAKFYDVGTGKSFPSNNLFFAVNSSSIHGFSFGQITAENG